MKRTFEVTNDSTFTCEGIDFKVSKDALWVDGGEHDDWLLRSIEALEEDADAEVEITITDKEMSEAVDYLYQLDDDAYTGASGNTAAPYAYALEGVDMEDVVKVGAVEYVESYAKTAISAANNSALTDAQMFSAWKGTGYHKEFVAYVQSQINAYVMEQVMTPAEIEKEFGLAEGTVRQAVNRAEQAGEAWFRRPDERTILIHRNEATRRWAKK